MLRDGLRSNTKWRGASPFAAAVFRVSTPCPPLHSFIPPSSLATSIYAASAMSHATLECKTTPECRVERALAAMAQCKISLARAAAFFAQS